MAELEIERLSLRFGGLTVLDSVSLARQTGELFALIGPNGAGKTSVLNCVSGIYRGEGEIRFRGPNISGAQPHEIARLGLARTFQHSELFPQMSVLDNLLTGRHARIAPTRWPKCCFCRLSGARRCVIARRSSASSSWSSSSAIATRGRRPAVRHPEAGRVRAGACARADAADAGRAVGRA